MALSSEHRGEGAFSVGSSTRTAHRAPRWCRPRHIEDRLGRWRRVGRVRGRDIGQGPDDPYTITIPDPKTPTILAWEPDLLPTDPHEQITQWEMDRYL